MRKTYLSLLRHLHTAVISKEKAPHKAILMLSVIEFVEEKRISSPCFMLTDELVTRFYKNWRKYVRSEKFKPVITTPYWHMQKEPFWKLNTFDGTELELSYSENYLKEKTFAIIDKNFFLLLQKRSNSQLFKDTIKYIYLNTSATD